MKRSTSSGSMAEMRIALFALVLAIGASPALSQQPASKPPQPEPAPVTVERFRIVSTTINGPEVPEQKMIFLLDTQTGKVWQYHPAPPAIRATDGKVYSVGPSFETVTVQ